MFNKNAIMIILENTYVEVTSRWYIDSVVKKEKTVWVYKLLAFCGNVFCSNWVTREVSQVRYSLVVILGLNSVSGVQYKGMMTDR